MIAFTSLLITVALSAFTPPSIWLATSLKMTPISARLAWGAVAAVTPSAKAHGRCEKPGRAVLRRQGGEIGIVVDDIENVEMARTQRGFCRRDAAEISTAIHRGRGRRERGRNIGQ